MKSFLRRHGSMLATMLGSLSLVAPADAQVTKIERRAYSRIEELRIELLRNLMHADPRVREATAAVCGRVPSGNPFEDLGRALAVARGQEPDAAFLMRTGVMTLALPEVLDPDAIEAVHVTMHTPRVVPEVGRVEFGIELRSELDPAAVRDAKIEFRTGPEDLLRFRATTTMPIAGLADGRYHVAVDLRLDGEGARPLDVVPGADVVVLGGFKARAEALPLLLDGVPERAEHASRIAASIPDRRRDADSQAILTAALWQVERVYSGEPAPFDVDPIADLGRAEAILANLQADRPALDGLSGRMTIGFPIGDGGRDVGTLTVDLPTPGPHGPLPLLVLVPGAPTWDRDLARPTSPRTSSPEWLAAQFRIGREPTVEPRDHEFFVASIESIGRFASGPRAIVAAVRFLQRILPVRERAVVVLGERESAFAVSRVALAEPELLTGIILVAGAGMSADELHAIGASRVMVVTAQDHASTPGLDWLAGQPEVVGTAASGVAWPLAVGLRAPEIVRFVAAQTGVVPAADELGGRVASGFIVLDCGPQEATRAFALAQWLRRGGVDGVHVRDLGSRDGFRVVVAALAADAAGVRERLAGLDPPAFEPRWRSAVAGLAGPEPIDR